MERLGVLELSIPGRHNLQNALAAVAVGERVGLDFGRVASALREFTGAERRFERHGEAAGVLVVDDYGHHPTEIAAVLSAARAAFGTKRILVAFQPHRYSRTAHQMDAFGPSLKDADEIVLSDIYAASEEPIPGITVDALAKAIRQGSGRAVTVAHTLDDVIAHLVAHAREGDVVITLGAGSIGTVPKRLVHQLRARGAA